MERLPSLSLSRTTSSRLRVPSGSTRGTTKQVRPPVAWASTRKTSFIGRRGEPLVPVQGVLAVDRRRPRLGHVGPDVGAALLLGHAHAGQRAGLLRERPEPGVVRRATRAAASTPCAIASSARSAGTAAYVIEIGQPCPGSVWDQAKKPAARRTCACGSPAALCSHGAACEPVADRALHQPVPGRVEHDLVDPVAVAVVRRQLGLVGSLASIPCSRASAEPASRPRATQVGDHVRRGVPGDGLDQRGVGGDHVVTDQRRRLVGGQSCGDAGSDVVDGHVNR